MAKKEMGDEIKTILREIGYTESDVDWTGLGQNSFAGFVINGIGPVNYTVRELEGWNTAANINWSKVIWLRMEWIIDPQTWMWQQAGSCNSTRAVSCNANSQDLHSEGFLFESRSRHWIIWLRFL